MKRIILVGFCAAMLLLSGCANKTAQVEPSEGETVVTPTEPAAPEANQNAGVSDGAAASRNLSVVYFDFDSYTIRGDQQSVISDLASAVTAGGSSVTFRVEGNCDEWGTEEYNYALGLSRAKSVRDALVQAGVNADRLTLISYGESNPVCAKSESDCWRQNRRVELTVLP